MCTFSFRLLPFGIQLPDLNSMTRQSSQVRLTPSKCLSCDTSRWPYTRPDVSRSDFVHPLAERGGIAVGGWQPAFRVSEGILQEATHEAKGSPGSSANRRCISMSHSYAGLTLQDRDNRRRSAAGWSVTDSAVSLRRSKRVHGRRGLEGVRRDTCGSKCTHYQQTRLRCLQIQDCYRGCTLA